MIPGMAGVLPGEAMYEGEKKLFAYQEMINVMEPEERCVAVFVSFLFVWLLDYQTLNPHPHTHGTPRVQERPQNPLTNHT